MEYEQSTGMQCRMLGMQWVASARPRENRPGPVAASVSGMDTAP